MRRISEIDPITISSSCSEVDRARVIEIIVHAEDGPLVRFIAVSKKEADHYIADLLPALRAGSKAIAVVLEPCTECAACPRRRTCPLGDRRYRKTMRTASPIGVGHVLTVVKPVGSHGSG